MSIQENNKMIAEFMQSIEDGLYLDGLYFYEGRYYDTNMEFHKSWDWLMPVVDKIEDMGCEIVTTNGKCTISGANDYYGESIGKSRRGATYDAIVEFINQYNKNQ
jgi:hypothetical protein